MSTDPTPRGSESREVVPQADRNITPKQAGSAALVLVVVVFALLNLQGVTMHWIVGTTHTPLIVVVALSALIGVAVGFLAGRRQRTSHGRSATDERR